MGSRLARPGAAVVLENRPKSYAGETSRFVRVGIADRSNQAVRSLRRLYHRLMVFRGAVVRPSASARERISPISCAGETARSVRVGIADRSNQAERSPGSPRGPVGRSAPLSFRLVVVPLDWNYLPIGLRKTFGFRGRTKSDNFIGRSACRRAGVEAGRRRGGPGSRRAGVEAAGVEAAGRADHTKPGRHTPMPERRHTRRGGGDPGARQSGA
jgi:hypothetical protein